MTNDTQLQLEDLNTVVAFGGGTGLGRLLSALSFLGDRLVGIVATTDDGGSTGRLRQATGCIAWGDLRNCLNQLCHTPTLGRLLFEYRFGANNGELSGHNLGNMMLLALDQLTARPLDAVNLVRDLLGVAPRLVPMSEQPTMLVAEEANGTVVSGESKIGAMNRLPRRLRLEPQVKATPEVLEALSAADLVLYAPGSFVTSILPSLLQPEIRTTLAELSRPRILLGNLAAEPGPVGQLTLGIQVGWLERVFGTRLVDAVLWPTERGPLSISRVPFVHKAPLAGADGLHDRELLVAALRALLHQLAHH